ncbi:hypothetical protein SAMN04488543_0719 [Friedmanniella luteola]|uniref:ACT domain-containing protein n=1 Tax=Friedmanniella luteola TaxID=546871 RepID=A0A1H1MUL9_9ACTN|nr:hypothetical protein [Friedmanniella luteola]SDR90380.1 hypothetical protein SAMN04488543_0719 [Friedmanniella luteola]
MHLMRVRMATGATVLGSVATRLGEAGVDINRLQTRRKDAHHVVLDLLLDVPAGQPLDLVVQHCQDLDGVDVEQVVEYPAGADLHQDLELVQRLTRSGSELAPQVLATAAPLLCGGTWAALVELPHRLTFRTARAPLLEPSDLVPLAGLQQTRAVELPDGCPAGSGPTQVAVVALPPGRALLVGRVGPDPFNASELARLDHLAEVATGARTGARAPG